MRFASRCRAHALVLLALVVPVGLTAQATGTLFGTVVDETTGEALVGARLSVSGTRVGATTDSLGVYELAELPPGQVAVRVELSGYAAIVEQIEVLPEEIGLFQFRLSPMAAAIRGLLVIAGRRDGTSGSESRVEAGDRAVARTALDLLRERVPGIAVRSRYGAGAGIRIRGASSLMNNDPALYIDGVLIASAGGVSAVHALEQIPAERVQRIRVLHGPSAAARYGDANNGVILVETR
jgi:TonB-dependent starch-binding outer membrane protein SusC